MPAEPSAPGRSAGLTAGGSRPPSSVIRRATPSLWCHGGLSSRVDIELARNGLDGLGVRIVTVGPTGDRRVGSQKGRSVADWPHDVAAVADELGIDRFAVAGWSAGGPFALACAAGAPERASTAVATIGGMAPIRSAPTCASSGSRSTGLLIPLSRRGAAGSRPPPSTSRAG